MEEVDEIPLTIDLLKMLNVDGTILHAIITHKSDIHPGWITYSALSKSMTPTTSRSTFIRHLNKLVARGTVLKETEGKHTYYAINLDSTNQEDDLE